MHMISAPKQLPANAYTPLPPGTVYQPPVAASEKLAELTPRSVGWGVFLCVVFTVASAYSGLKVGQVMEAAIPISILANYEGITPFRRPADVYIERLALAVHNKSGERHSDSFKSNSS